MSWPHGHEGPAPLDSTPYDRLAPWYSRMEGFWERGARERGLCALAPREGENILEVGPGPGLGLSACARAVGPSGSACGVDRSRAMLGHCWANAALIGASDRLLLVQGDALALPLAAATFDAILFSFCLERFSDREVPRVLSECRRVIRSGGRLVVVALSTAGPPNPLRALYATLHRRFPALLDCHPIPVAARLAAGGFSVGQATLFSLWGLPVEVVTATLPGGVCR